MLNSKRACFRTCQATKSIYSSIKGNSVPLSIIFDPQGKSVTHSASNLYLVTGRWPNLKKLHCYLHTLLMKLDKGYFVLT